MSLLINKHAKRGIPLFAFLFLGFSYCFSQYWERTLGCPETWEYIYNIDESYDNGYIIGNVFIDKISPNYQDCTISSFIYKTDINGDTLWYRNFRHDPLLLYSCRDVGDGTTVALFNSYDYINDCSRILLTRLDECGNKLWCKDIIDPLGFGYGSADMEVINNKILHNQKRINVEVYSAFIDEYVLSLVSD